MVGRVGMPHVRRSEMTTTPYGEDGGKISSFITKFDRERIGVGGRGGKPWLMTKMAVCVCVRH